jgi:bla regulator protein blaR1
MSNRFGHQISFVDRMNLTIAAVGVLTVSVIVGMAAAQAPLARQADPSRTEFDVASVKPVDFQLRHAPTFPIDNSDAFVAVGRFSATFPVWAYIAFAYKISPYERRTALSHLPSWVNDWNDGLFAIEARAEGQPTKEKMRLMMQALLADRFKLAIHFENREIPVFALTLDKAGTTGPKLIPHALGPPCLDSAANQTPARADGTFPPDCEVVGLQLNGLNERLGSRNASLTVLADAIAGYHDIDRPVVERTGLSGKFDFTVEYTAEMPAPPTSNAPLAAVQGLSFVDAVREQLGLRLVATRASVRVIVIDHIEKPSAN